MGSWIGGDRDGNPFVTAEVLRGTLRMQSSRVLRFYLEELHELGAELSLAAHLADISEELRALAERSPDTSPHRSGEPYRLAVTGIYARLAATARGSTSNQAAAGRQGRALSRSGIQGRSRHAPSLADREQFARHRARPAAAVAPRGGLLRLSSRQPRYPPELRRA